MPFHSPQCLDRGESCRQLMVVGEGGCHTEQLLTQGLEGEDGPCLPFLQSRKSLALALVSLDFTRLAQRLEKLQQPSHIPVVAHLIGPLSLDSLTMLLLPSVQRGVFLSVELFFFMLLLHLELYIYYYYLYLSWLPIPIPRAHVSQSLLRERLKP